MGVIGLWRLLDPTGKPVPLETLEGKVLAIDVSIWIHQVLQGYQDGRGNPMPNAHLLGLFNRICKLLFYKIKPVFVFDGGVPLLKKSTIAARRKQKSVVANKAQKMKNDLINNLIKHTAIKSVLGQNDPAAASGSSQMKANFLTKEDIYKLPELPSTSTAENAFSDDDYDSDSSMEPSPKKQTKWVGNIHNVDVTSNDFKSLPPDVRYDILTDLKETRKQNSWGRLHEMPEESNQFSGFQMKRLLKRRLVQESLESAEHEMGGKTLTLAELDQLLSEPGILTAKRANAFRIASDSTTRVLYISDTKALKQTSSTNSANELSSSESTSTKKDLNADSRSLSPIIDNMKEYDFDDWDSDVESIRSDETNVTLKNIQNSDVNVNSYDALGDSDAELNESHCLSKKYFGKINKNPALSFMLEYSGLSQEQIVSLIKQSKSDSSRNKGKKSTSSGSKKSKVESASGSTKSSDVNNKSNLGENIACELLRNDDSSSLTDTKLDHVAKESESIKETNKSTERVDEIQNEVVKLKSAEEESKLVEKSSECAAVDSSSESDDFVEVNNEPEAINNVKGSASNDSPNAVVGEKCESNDDKANATIRMDSDSSSDDFVEVHDVPIPEIKAPKPGLQITIKADTKFEDDLFADVFQNKTSDPVELEAPKKTGDLRVSQNISSRNVEAASQNINTQSKKLEAILEESTAEDHAVVNLIENETNSTGDKEVEKRLEDNQLKEVSNNDTENTNKSANEECRPVVFDDGEELEFLSSNIETANSEQKRSAVLPTDKEELAALKAQLEDQQKELEGNIGKLERQATDVTDQIRIEAQELLKLFGIPYIVAPMEAEAQCAYLEEINLTDGTITDDSDIWLFGGRCVYKNFFNNNKRVLQFLSADIQHHFKLTRQQLIQLALLVGSDYTTGVPGIGPVTALEVLASFPSEDENLLRGLMNFSTWVKSGKPPGPGKTSLRNKLKNVQIEKGFPSQAVAQAYLFPTIDDSKEKFSWGKPDLIHMADYVRRKFGWTKFKFDQIIGPVMKRFSESKSQKGIDAFFKVKTVPKSIEANLSKRVQKAVERIGEDPRQSGDADDTEVEKKAKPKSAARRTRKTKETPEIPEEQLALVELSDETNLFKSNSPIKTKNAEELIPQREKDKVNALKKKMHAIEVFRKSKKGLSKAKKVKRSVRKVTKEAELSESSSSS